MNRRGFLKLFPFSLGIGCFEFLTNKVSSYSVPSREKSLAEHLVYSDNINVYALSVDYHSMRDKTITGGTGYDVYLLQKVVKGCCFIEGYVSKSRNHKCEPKYFLNPVVPMGYIVKQYSYSIPQQFNRKYVMNFSFILEQEVVNDS